MLSAELLERQGIIERRAYPRYMAKKRIFSSFKYHGELIVGEVIDISEGGLSFKYVTDFHDRDITENGRLYDTELLNPEDRFWIQDLKCRVVYTRPISYEVLTLLNVKKCGLMFIPSQNGHLSKVKELIDKIAR